MLSLDIKILAIDPGREKCGLAVVNSLGEAIFLEIISIAQIATRVEKILHTEQIDYVAIGDGTNSKDIFAAIKKIKAQLKIVIVDEKNTTYNARELYWQRNPPTGWQKFLPRGLRNITEPIDDYAAWLIGKKFLTELK